MIDDQKRRKINILLRKNEELEEMNILLLRIRCQYISYLSEVLSNERKVENLKLQVNKLYITTS